MPARRLQAVAISELQDQLRVALQRIDELERELEARRRAEADRRLAGALTRPQAEPKVRKRTRLRDAHVAEHGRQPVACFEPGMRRVGHRPCSFGWRCSSCCLPSWGSSITSSACADIPKKKLVCRSEQPNALSHHPGCSSCTMSVRSLAPRVARILDLAIGERIEGPIFMDGAGGRLDRHAAGRIVR
jgi:hypothetical protein